MMRSTRLSSLFIARAAVLGLSHVGGAGSGSRGAACSQALTTAWRAATAAAGAGGAPQVLHYSKLGMDGFTDIKFNSAADELLELVETQVDALDSASVDDVSCNGGVLTLETAERGTFILNKQAPNVQLWLSSPISGPHHYDMITVTQDGNERVLWRSDNDGHDLVEKLERELTEVLGSPLKL
ncbi:frataxin-like protein [Novymonas esmeraldas]|uniref:ferroxidase n=1 Tax=Novymonas esmeraldas TaxID=1808958 RepID=A0AAW0F4Y5_9TRYP